MDFIDALDPSSLTLLHAGIAFVLSPFVSPTYNLPVFLYGLWAVQVTETYEPLRVFAGFVGTSLLLDVIWLFNNDPATLVKIILILTWLFKILTFLSIMVSLRHRGDRFGASLPTAGEFNNRAQTVWNMPTPGGLGAYSAVGGDSGAEHPAKPLPNAPSPAPAAPTMPHVAPSQSTHQHQAQPGHVHTTAAGGPPAGTFTL
ncbi:hypothetical protein M408DRAFT_89504 [Serendipita vermifera MAFF 305830]|uniref:Uncharacterized protein n=1 Tax=Serendipita vermifera MAFF 305830 TaxID=933852 RepID=A0A0C3BPK0_SERVB|nr:hypothetical protein M408DRAFT_89504 [Serendipita vermifera MAFF 305830]